MEQNETSSDPVRQWVAGEQGSDASGSMDVTGFEAVSDPFVQGPLVGAYDRVHHLDLFPGQIVVVLLFDPAADQCGDPFREDQAAKVLGRGLGQDQGLFVQDLALGGNFSDEEAHGQIKAGCDVVFIKDDEDARSRSGSAIGGDGEGSRQIR
jgi:hypothetical protein